MSQADQIRKFIIDRYLSPARAAGKGDVIIRAGDVHSAMGLANAFPAVCSALRGSKLEDSAGVKLLDVTGPANGANVYFRFDLTARKERDISLPSSRRVEKARSTACAAIDFSGALVLVSCVKTKLPRPAPAGMLYCSDWFTKVRRLVEARNARWFVLSALHGLVEPDRVIAPYELTLNNMGVAQRRAWAAGVYQALEPELAGYQRVVFFAGVRYREFLVEPITRGGRPVEIPMEGLAQGEQLSWLGGQL